MKFIKKTKIIIFLLIFVTLLFALLGSLNLYSTKEGHYLHDCSGDIVPACSSDLNDSNIEDELQYYALKTELVPPICPNCPYYADISYGSYHNSPDDVSNTGSSNGSTKIKGDNNNNSNSTDVNIGNETKVDQSTNIKTNSEYSNNQEDNSTTSQDNSVSQNTNTKQSITQDNSQDNSVKQDNSQSASADNKWNNLFGNNSISFGGGGRDNSTIQSNNGQGPMGVSSPALAGSINPSPYGQNFNSTPYLLQQGSYLQGSNLETNNIINNLKKEVDRLTNSNNSADSTPPCPACERCPEPSFECKKVPNYRSSSIDSYMPVPILNDFSRF